MNSKVVVAVAGWVVGQMGSMFEFDFFGNSDVARYSRITSNGKKSMAIKTTTSSAAEQLKKLRDEADKIEQEAAAKKAAVQVKIAELNASVADELVSRGMEAIEGLRDIGYSTWAALKMLAGKAGVPFTGKEPAGKSSKSGDVRKGTRTTNPDRACPICEFKTVPPHDARRHRGQTEKRPFTAEELHSMGMHKA